MPDNANKQKSLTIQLNNNMKLNFREVYVGDFNNSELLGTATDEHGNVCLVVLDNDGKVKACPIDEIRNCTIVKEDITPKRKQHRSEEQ